MALSDSVPSSAIDVFKRNSEDTDKVVNQESGSVTTRTGKEIKSFKQLEGEFRAAIASGEQQIESAITGGLYTPVGDFGTQFTITERREVGYDGSVYWRWNGALPHTVLATDTPSEPDWTDVTQATLAADLVNPAESGNRVARMAITADSLVNFLDVPFIDGRTYSNNGFYPDMVVGGGQWKAVSGLDKATNNGGTVVTVEALQAWYDAAVAAGGVTTANLQANLNVLFTAGTGTGDGFVRVNFKKVSPEEFGAMGDGVILDTDSISASFSSGYSVELSKAIYLCETIYFNPERNLEQLHISGQGPLYSIIRSISNGRSIDTSPYSGTNFMGDVKLSDFTVDGNGTATEFFIYRCTNIHTSKFRCINHAGKNFRILRSYQFSASESRFTVYTQAEPECAAYIATNAANFGNQTYFNTDGRGSSIIIDNNEDILETLQISMNNCVFENYLTGIKIIDNIDTSCVNITECYFESPSNTNAVPLRVKGGFHSSINMNKNHIQPSTLASAVIDNVDSRSVINIKDNTLHRPVLLYVPEYAAGTVNIFDLPSININNQIVQAQAISTTFDHVPTLILNDSVAFRYLEVSKIKNPIDNRYNLVKGAVYKRTNYTTGGEDILRVVFPPNPGTSYAYGFSADINVTWRPYTASVTGDLSFEVEHHKITAVGRSTGTIRSGSGIASIFTEVNQLSSVSVVENSNDNSIDIVGSGDPTRSVNEWFLDFKIQAVR